MARQPACMDVKCGRWKKVTKQRIQISEIRHQKHVDVIRLAELSSKVEYEEYAVESGRMALLATSLLLATCLDHSSTLKMEAICSSEA
jgi:hypothetical protein